MPQEELTLIDYLLLKLSDQTDGRLTRSDAQIVRTIFNDVTQNIRTHIKKIIAADDVRTVISKMIEEAAERAMSQRPNPRPRRPRNENLREFITMDRQPATDWTIDLFSAPYIATASAEQILQIYEPVLRSLKAELYTDVNLKKALVDNVCNEFPDHSEEDLNAAFDWIIRTVDAIGDPEQKNLRMTLIGNLCPLFLSKLDLDDGYNHLTTAVTSFESYLKQLYFLTHEEPMPKIVNVNQNNPCLADALAALGIPTKFDKCQTDEEHHFSQFIAMVAGNRNYWGHNSPQIDAEKLNDIIHALGTVLIFVTLRHVDALERNLGPASATVV
jgi:hypothetical protein